MSLFKMKRGQESKVSSLAKEDGSLIFSLDGANDSTLRLDQSVSGTVQRLGIAVDKAKSADSASSASSATNASTANYAKNAGNADTIDGFHYDEAPYKYLQTFNQPIANTIWYLKVKTPDWNRISETIKVKASGDNRNSTTILKVGSRQSNWWGYATYYNGTCLTGVKVVISNSNDTYLRFDEGTTSATIYTTFNATIETSTVTDDYISVPEKGGIFGNIITGTLKGTADNSNALGGSSLSQVLASAGGGNAFTGLDTTTNNKVKLTRANGGTVEKTINNVSNASSANFASTATLATYPQGFESRMTSATWGNTTGTFLTGWHTSSGGDVAFMNNNPSSGKLSMKLDGYFYQNEGANRVLDTSDAANYVKKAGDTMTGLLTLKIGSQQGIKLGSAWMTAVGDKDGEFVLQGGHLRFGASDWDYDKWAGLKYDPDNKYVYLGIADGKIFTANSKPQSGGLLFTPGISGIYIGGTTTTRVATSSDLSSYVAKSGDTMTGTLQVNAPIFGYRYGSNNDSPAFVFDKPGNHYTGIGAHGTDTIYFSAVNTSGLTWNHDYKQKWVFNGSVSASTVTADYFDGTIANATSAANSARLGGRIASDYALKDDLSGDINALSAKRLPSYQSVSVANSFFYRYGVVGNTSDGGAWTGFPSATLYNAASTVNGFGNALFQKKVGVLHLASGSSAHDLVFQAGGTNGGIAYVATGRNPAYILDTLNYKDKAYTFNKLTASSTFTATSGVVIDGGSY